MSRFADTPKPPYYAVIFPSQLQNDTPDYMDVAMNMVELAKDYPGYLGIESSRDPGGFGITISYWESLEAIEAWRKNAEHLVAQERGKREWYSHFELRIAKVERASFGPGTERP